MPFLDGILYENVLFNLTSENSELRIFCTYTNGNLQGLYVLENEGTPVLTKSTVSINAVESAKDFLTNYQTYSNKQILGELQSTLMNADTNKNIPRLLATQCSNKLFIMTARRISNGTTPQTVP